MGNLWGGHLGNAYFTGHQTVLETLHQRLQQEKVVALCGLGGMGKSELATEYLSDYIDSYQAVIWLNASSKGAMNRELTTMCQVASNLFLSFLAANKKTLLILDDIRDFSLVPSGWQGYLILTTRFAQSRFPQFLMPTLSLEESTLLLLRRGRYISPQGSLEEASEPERAGAAKIAQLLAGYPLALNQAAVRLILGTSFGSYLSFYQTSFMKLFSSDLYDSSSLALVDVIQETIRLLSLQGQNLLRMIASLPSNGAAVAIQQLHSDHSSLDELLRVFLVQCDPDRLGLSMHPLVRKIVTSCKEG